MSNTQTVQQIYEAFGRGDIPAILARLSPIVDWEYGETSTDVPWLQRRTGPAEVVGFFESLAAIDIHSFVPTAILEAGQKVVVLVQLDATVRATGKRVVEEDEVHIWQFGIDGLVSRFRHRADTHLQWKAYHG